MTKKIIILTFLLSFATALHADKGVYTVSISSTKKLVALKPGQSTRVSIRTSEGLVKLSLTKKNRIAPTGYLLTSQGKIATQAPELQLFRGKILPKSNRQNKSLTASASIYKGKITIKFAGNRKKLFAITSNSNSSKARSSFYPGHLSLDCGSNHNHTFKSNLHFDKLPASVRASRTLELGMHADFEYYQENSSDSADTIAALETIVNDVDAIYSGQLDVNVVLSGYQIQTSSSQPYTSFNTGTLLNQFGIYLSDHPGDRQGDLEHLMTGKNTAYEGNSSVAGLAYVGVVCSSDTANIGLSERFGSAVQHLIVAHELGHNFGANHDTSDSSSIMYPSVSPSQVTFSNFSIDEISDHLSGNDDCLEGGSSEPSADLQFKAKLTDGNKFKFIITAEGESLVGCTINIYGASSSSRLTSSPTLILTATGTVGAGEKQKYKFSGATKTPKATAYFKAMATCASELESSEKTVEANSGTDLKQVKVSKFLEYLISKFS